VVTLQWAEQSLAVRKKKKKGKPSALARDYVKSRKEKGDKGTRLLRGAAGGLPSASLSTTKKISRHTSPKTGRFRKKKEDSRSFKGSETIMHVWKETPIRLQGLKKPIFRRTASARTTPERGS